MNDSLIISTGSAPRFTVCALSDADCMLAYSLGIIGVAGGNTQFGASPKKRRRGYPQVCGELGGVIVRVRAGGMVMLGYGPPAIRLGNVRDLGYSEVRRRPGDRGVGGNGACVPWHSPP